MMNQKIIAANWKMHKTWCILENDASRLRL